MSYTITPTQVRYNDPYDQIIFEFSDSRVYLSKNANRILNVIGNDFVIKGMQMTSPTIVSGDTVRISISPGWAIQDETLVQFTDESTVDIDCSGLVDTSVDGAHLAVFLNYEHIHTAEANLAAVDIFHVEASGAVNDLFNRFDTRSCRILLGIIDFTKSGSLVTSASISDLVTLLVSGQTYYVKGLNYSNINIPSLFNVVFGDDREYLLKRDYLMAD